MLVDDDPRLMTTVESMLDGVVAVALALSGLLAVEAVVPGVVLDVIPWVRCWAAVY